MIQRGPGSHENDFFLLPNRRLNCKVSVFFEIPLDNVDELLYGNTGNRRSRLWQNGPFPLGIRCGQSLFDFFYRNIREVCADLVLHFSPEGGILSVTVIASDLRPVLLPPTSGPAGIKVYHRFFISPIGVDYKL